MVAKGGLIFEGKCIFENKPHPQSRSCLLLKKGGGGGAYFREDTVHVDIRSAIHNIMLAGYRMVGNFRGVLIFVIFVVNLAVTKFFHPQKY